MFTYPKHERRTYDDYKPVERFETYYVEEALNTRQFHHTDLRNEDKCAYEYQSLAAFQMQGAAMRSKGTSIEEVEEVSHHEDSEEQCQFVWCYGAVLAYLHTHYVGELLYIGMLKDIKQGYEQGEEEATYAYNLSKHRSVDNKCTTVARSVVHNRL